MMSTVRKYQPHYTVEDYRQWKGDWELWYGTAVAMSPSPFGPHERAVSALRKSANDDNRINLSFKPNLRSQKTKGRRCRSKQG